MEPDKKLEKKVKDYRHAISFRLILDCLCFEDLPAMLTSCVEVQRALKNYTGFVMARRKFGAKAQNIGKKEVFEWYVARLSSTGTFGAPAGDAFLIWFSAPLYQQGLFEICLWHDSVPLLEMLMQEAPNSRWKSVLLEYMRYR